MATDVQADKSFNFFEALFTHAKNNNVLIIDDAGLIISVNTAFTLSFGYAEQDIIGKHLSVLFTKEDQLKGLPEREIKTVLHTGRSADNNYLLQGDRSVTWVSGESILVKNEKGKPVILKVIQNIHKQKETEIALRSSNDFNENILRSIVDAVIVLDDKLNLVKANSAFTKLLGGDVKDTTVNFADLIKPYNLKDQLLNSIKYVIAAKVSFSNRQIEMATADGITKIFDVSCTPIPDTDDTKVLLVIHDITILKQMEREREDIIGFVAHELRNPLANLVLCNDIMSEAIQNNNVDELKDMLQRSKNNVKRLNKMIGELYEATEVNAGFMKLEIVPFNFNEMVREAIDTVKVLQPAYNIIVKGSADINVLGDKHRLMQVITNYLSNGIKYSNGKTDVILTIRHDADELKVSVKDEGLGISKEQLPFIFERFFRAEKTKNIEGIGLGLYLCRQIIRTHGGRVWAESEEGKGSVFYFSIPVSR